MVQAHTQKASDILNVTAFFESLYTYMHTYVGEKIP